MASKSPKLSQTNSQVDDIKILSSNGSSIPEIKSNFLIYCDHVIAYCEDVIRQGYKAQEHQEIIDLLKSPITLKKVNATTNRSSKWGCKFNQTETEAKKWNGAIIMSIRSTKDGNHVFFMNLTFKNRLTPETFIFLKEVFIKSENWEPSTNMQSLNVIETTASKVSDNVQAIEVTEANKSGISSPIHEDTSNVIGITDKPGELVAATPSAVNNWELPVQVQSEDTKSNKMHSSKEIVSSQIPHDAFMKILYSIMKDTALEPVDPVQRVYFLPDSDMKSIFTQWAIYGLSTDLITETRFAAQLPASFLQYKWFFRPHFRINRTNIAAKQKTEAIEILETLMTWEERVVSIEGQDITYIQYLESDLQVVRDLVKWQSPEANLLNFYSQVNTGDTRDNRTLVKWYLVKLPDIDVAQVFSHILNKVTQDDLVNTVIWLRNKKEDIKRQIEELQRSIEQYQLELDQKSLIIEEAQELHEQKLINLQEDIKNQIADIITDLQAIQVDDNLLEWLQDTWELVNRAKEASIEYLKNKQESQKISQVRSRKRELEEKINTLNTVLEEMISQLEQVDIHLTPYIEELKKRKKALEELIG